MSTGDHYSHTHIDDHSMTSTLHRVPCTVANDRKPRKRAGLKIDLNVLSAISQSQPQSLSLSLSQSQPQPQSQPQSQSQSPQHSTESISSITFNDNINVNVNINNITNTNYTFDTLLNACSSTISNPSSWSFDNQTSNSSTSSLSSLSSLSTVSSSSPSSSSSSSSSPSSLSSSPSHSNSPSPPTSPALMVDLTPNQKRQLLGTRGVCSSITDTLFVGDEEVASNGELLQRLGITHVLNCAAATVPNYHPTLFEYEMLFLSDTPSEDIFCLFIKVIDFIEHATARGGRILIHCQCGVSRSSAMAICYLIHRYRWTYALALEYIQSRRIVCEPNVGYALTLIEWCDHLLAYSNSQSTAMSIAAAHLSPLQPLSTTSA